MSNGHFGGDGTRLGRDFGNPLGDQVKAAAFVQLQTLLESHTVTIGLLKDPREYVVIVGTVPPQSFSGSVLSFALAAAFEGMQK